MLPVVTPENYFSFETDIVYMSVSQFKSWMECEFLAYEVYVTGKLRKPKTTAQKKGSFVHAIPPGLIAQFMKDNPDIFLESDPKTLKAEFRLWKDNYFRAMQDKLFAAAMTGEHELIIVLEDLYGFPWKFALDVVNHEKRFITDLKTTEDFTKKRKYKDGEWVWLPFYEYWDYWVQFSMYGLAAELKFGHEYELYCAAVTGETPPDFDVLHFHTNKDRLLRERERVEENMPRIIDLKRGDAAPEHCRNFECKYCRKNKRLSKTTKAESFF